MTDRSTVPESAQPDDGATNASAARWDARTDPKHMLDDCNDLRKLRLFACACARRVWHLMPDGPFRAAVELAERYADGGRFLDAERDALKARCEAANPIRQWKGAAASATGCLTTNASGAAWESGWSAAVAETLKNEGPAFEAARAKQADLLREIFGNPLRPVRADPAWLAWNAGTVPQIATRIYDEQSYGDLPVLADALEDAGCTNAEILSHLRDAREHVRGCWALDLLRDAPA